MKKKNKPENPGSVVGWGMREKGHWECWEMLWRMIGHGKCEQVSKVQMLTFGLTMRNQSCRVLGLFLSVV